MKIFSSVVHETVISNRERLSDSGTHPLLSFISLIHNCLRNLAVILSRISPTTDRLLSSAGIIKRELALAKVGSFISAPANGLQQAIAVTLMPSCGTTHLPNI